MTQIPPPPPMQPTVPNYGAGAPKKTNGLAIASIITAVVGFCVPVVGGLAAIILGVLGIRKSRESGGKGLAIAGVVVGVISLIVPLLFFGSIFGIVMGATSAGRDAAKQWMVATSAGDIDKAVSLSSAAVTREEIEAIHETLKPLGAFQDMTSSNVNLQNSELHLQGTATFANGTQAYKMVLINTGDAWKLEGLEFE